MNEIRPLSPNERIKESSRFLRGTISDGLSLPETGAIADDDQQLVKFHGIYLQDDRDLRADGVRVTLFQQRREANGNWVDMAVEAKTATDLEDTILTRARQLRVEQASR